MHKSPAAKLYTPRFAYAYRRNHHLKTRPLLWRSSARFIDGMPVVRQGEDQGGPFGGWRQNFDPIDLS